MGTVSRPPRAATPTVAEAIAAYLSTLDHPESAGTLSAYAGRCKAEYARPVELRVPGIQARPRGNRLDGRGIAPLRIVIA